MFSNLNLIFIMLLSLSSCNEVGTDAMYIMPNDYQGAVFIVYDQKDGIPPKYEEGKRVYEIPSNGILNTQFTPNEGWRFSDKFYYIDKGQKKEILYEQVPKTIKGDTIKVCCFSSGTSSANPMDTSSVVKFAVFYVGTEKNLDSIYKQGEKINPATLIKHN